MSCDVRKVALVTGGARRVGRSISLALHNNGYNVVVHYNTSESHAKELTEKMNRAHPDSAIPLKADLSADVERTCESLVERVVNKWQRLDVVVNNAANFYPESLLEMTSEQFDLSINVNFKAPSFIIKTAANYLKKQNGCIVNIVDVVGEYPLKSHYCYGISKASLIACIKSAAQLLAPEVRVNAISPGCVMWPEVDEDIFDEKAQKKWMDATPLQRFGTPENVAQTVLFLISPEASSFITGQIIRLDGGRTLSVLNIQ